jgi:hypothetical protein
MGVHRQDHLLEDNITPRVNAAAFDESKETEVLKESTGALCIGMVLIVLITTVTFRVTFAVPVIAIMEAHQYLLEGMLLMHSSGPTHSPSFVPRLLPFLSCGLETLC